MTTGSRITGGEPDSTRATWSGLQTELPTSSTTGAAWAIAM